MHKKKQTLSWTLSVGSLVTLCCLLIALLVSGLAHGWNMFNFPYYENDEGVYVSQAWSLMEFGKLAPYTYWYDHAPAGWIFIAIWLMFTGGLYTFGFSLNSGRVFMLVLHVLSTALLFTITKKLTKSNFAALISSLLFALTPIGLYFHRRVLLDNIMAFWVLLSYFFLLREKIKLHQILLSAVCFGIAVLTKENAIFFIPGFLVTIFVVSHHYHRKLALAEWIIISGSIISLYFLYAALKKELFPSGTWFGGNNPHVSLLETLKYQASRKDGAVQSIMDTSFWRHFTLWIKQDPFLIFAGMISNVLLFLFAVLRRKWIQIGTLLLGLLFWFFLVRGGIVIEFYIVPLIPWLCLFIGLFVAEVMELVQHWTGPAVVRGIYIGLVINLAVGYYFFSQVSRAFGQNTSARLLVFQSKQTSSQLDALQFIRQNIDPQSVVIIDNHTYLDLRDPQNPSGVIFPKAEWYWKVDEDPEVKIGVLQDNPENIDIIAETPQMTGDLQMGTSPLTSEAKTHAKIWKSFEVDGWSVHIWRTQYPTQILRRSWQSYKRNFITLGKVTDLQQENVTTSEGQSYALLRAVWMNDKVTFDEVYAWTERHLKNDDDLYSWKGLTDSSGRFSVTDTGSASDADQDIALSLLFAYKKWQDPKYLSDAQKLLTAIWEHEVKQVADKTYLVPGPWAVAQPGALINPSYFSPASYRIFQQVDFSHDWESLVNSSYEVLSSCSSANLDTQRSTGLPPEWCVINEDGSIDIPKEEGLNSSKYSYNAFRVPWRVGLDAAWYDEPRARSYLSSLQFLLQKWNTDKKLLVAYTHDGQVWENHESVAAYAGNLALFSIVAPDTVTEIYNTKIRDKFFEDELNSYWEDPRNYYSQNWAWFGTAFYAGKLPNLWQESRQF